MNKIKKLLLYLTGRYHMYLYDNGLIPCRKCDRLFTSYYHWRGSKTVFDVLCPICRRKEIEGESK